jgi:hypothetical protein
LQSALYQNNGAGSFFIATTGDHGPMCPQLDRDTQSQHGEI